MKKIAFATAAALGLLASSAAYAGFYIPTCYQQWVLGPYGWYLQTYCY